MLCENAQASVRIWITSFDTTVLHHIYIYVLPILYCFNLKLPYCLSLFTSLSLCILFTYVSCKFYFIECLMLMKREVMYCIEHRCVFFLFLLSWDDYHMHEKFTVYLMVLGSEEKFGFNIQLSSVYAFG